MLMRMAHLSTCGVTLHHPLRSQSMAEGVEQLTEVSQQDLRDNQAILTSGASALHVRFEGASNCQEIPAEISIDNTLES